MERSVKSQTIFFVGGSFHICLFPALALTVQVRESSAPGLQGQCFSYETMVPLILLGAVWETTVSDIGFGCAGTGKLSVDDILRNQFSMQFHGGLVSYPPPCLLAR